MSLTERIQAAIAHIKKVQRTEPIRYMCDDRVPIDLEGTMELPIIPERQYVVEYFKYKHIDNDVLNRYLFDMAQDFMQGL